MIGLIDCETLNKKSIFIPNLEIMKLYAYYKNEGMVRLLLDDTLLDACSTIYLRKETEESSIPVEWLRNRDVKWGGKVFTNGRYVPLLNGIENTTPNYRVYNKYIEDVIKKDFNKNLPEAKFLDYSFIRIYNGSSLQRRHIREGMPLLIYDDYLFQKNCEKQFEKIKDCEPSNVYYTKPVLLKSTEDMDMFKKYNLTSINTTSLKLIDTKIILDIDFSVPNFISFMNKHSEYFNLFNSGTILFPSLNSFQITRNSRHFSYFFEKLVNFVYYTISQGMRPAIYKTWLPADDLGQIMNCFISYINTTSNWRFTFKTYMIKQKPTANKKLLKQFLTTYPHLNYLFSAECMDLNLGGTWYG